MSPLDFRESLMWFDLRNCLVMSLYLDFDSSMKNCLISTIWSIVLSIQCFAFLRDRLSQLNQWFLEVAVEHFFHKFYLNHQIKRLKTLLKTLWGSMTPKWTDFDQNQVYSSSESHDFSWTTQILTHLNRAVLILPPLLRVSICFC